MSPAAILKVPTLVNIPESTSPFAGNKAAPPKSEPTITTAVGAAAAVEIENSIITRAVTVVNASKDPEGLKFCTIRLAFLIFVLGYAQWVRLKRECSAKS